MGLFKWHVLADIIVRLIKTAIAKDFNIKRIQLCEDVGRKKKGKTKEWVWKKSRESNQEMQYFKIAKKISWEKGKGKTILKMEKF